MKIALDAMSGDFAPHSTVEGAVLFTKEIAETEIILVGKEEVIREELKKYSYDKERIRIQNAKEIIEMTDHPVEAIRNKKDSSMNVALDLVKKGEADACVSSGNTGALLSASQLKLKRIKGVLRPAIASVFPSKKGQIVMLDLGATADCKAEYLNQFSSLASKYAELLLGVNSPRVGLLNIGEEVGKGNELTREAYTLLQTNQSIHFIGNIEATQMMEGKVDVVVTDGFTGNMVLKTAEGTAKLITSLLKETIQESLLSKIGALFLKKSFIHLKEKMDSSEYGGAIFLGLNEISIKAHGNSNANGIKNALKVADKFSKINLIEQLKKVIEEEVN